MEMPIVVANIDGLGGSRLPCTMAVMAEELSRYVDTLPRRPLFNPAVSQ